MSNHSQYLLSVAEKIMEKQVDKEVLNKYYRIKQASNTDVKKSHARESSKLDKKNARPSVKSMNRPSSNMKKCHPIKTQAIARQAYTDVMDHKQNRMSNTCKTISSKYNTCQEKYDGQTYILSHMSELLKNAVKYPYILSNVNILENKQHQITMKNREYLRQISNSLSKIYGNLTKIDLQSTISKDKIRISFPMKQIPAKSDKDQSIKNQLIKDNKWLLQKLENIVKQNLILRRMIGKH